MKIELMKKTLATIMALTVVCGAQTAVKAYQPTVGITAVAADIVASGKCGENATWQLDSEGKLTISGKGAAIEPSEWRGANPELSSDKVVSLVIEEGITELGDRMFSNFKNLESVSMPENVLFHTYDAPGTTETFRWCPKLNFGTCGKYLTWRYDTDTKSLFIDGNGPIVYCSYITMGTYAAAPWVTKNYSEYKHIYLSEGVTWFNTLAFLYCDGYGRGEKPEITILNPECDVNGLISEEDHDPDGNLVKVVSKIYGYTNSTAHTFALENDIPFEAIDEPVVSTTTTIITTSATSTTTTSKATTTAANTTTQMPTTTSTTSTTTTQKHTTTSTASTTAPETTKTGEITVVASGKCGENAIWQLDSDGKMTISGEGAVSRPTEWYNAEIRNKVFSLVIEDGITELGNQMFKGFENLETVSMPQNVLFISHYGGNTSCDTFYECSKLNFGTCGPYITWKYDEETNSLFINGKGTMQDYYYITAGKGSVAPWSHNRDNNKIDKIFLSEDVERIGMCAFFYCGYYEDGISKRPEITVLNPECDVDWLLSDSYTVDENGNRFKLVSKIYGYENSTAQKFAIENNIPFESLDKAITTTTSTNTLTTTTTTQKPTTTSTNTSTTTTTTTQKPTTTSTNTSTTTTTTQKPTTTSTNTSTTSTTTAVVTTTTAIKASFGDANGDDAINAVDASIALSNYARYSTSTDTPTEYELATQDVNGDGFVNAVDASTILSYYAYASVGGKLSFPEYIKNPNADPKDSTTTTTTVPVTATTTTTTTATLLTTTTQKPTTTTTTSVTSTTTKPTSTTSTSTTMTSRATTTSTTTVPVSTTTIVFINPQDVDYGNEKIDNFVSENTDTDNILNLSEKLEKLDEFTLYTIDKNSYSAYTLLDNNQCMKSAYDDFYANGEHITLGENERKIIFTYPPSNENIRTNYGIINANALKTILCDIISSNSNNDVSSYGYIDNRDFCFNSNHDSITKINNHSIKAKTLETILNNCKENYIQKENKPISIINPVEFDWSNINLNKSIIENINEQGELSTANFFKTSNYNVSIVNNTSIEYTSYVTPTIKQTIIIDKNYSGIVFIIGSDDTNPSTAQINIYTYNASGNGIRVVESGTDPIGFDVDISALETIERSKSQPSYCFYKVKNEEINNGKWNKLIEVH